MARRLLLLALLASLAGSASAQTAALNGFVRDAQSGETLLQATVRVEGTARGAATNVSGFYTLGDLPPGEAEGVVGGAAQVEPGASVNHAGRAQRPPQAHVLALEGHRPR